MEVITSLQNQKVLFWNRLKQKKERDERGLFLIEGEHMCEEAEQKGYLQTLITDLKSPRFSAKETVFVSEAVMHKLSSSVSGTHYIGICGKRTPSEHAFERLLLLDGIQDPGNLGTMIRTAVSFGFDAVYCSTDTCDVYNEKVLRSTQGAVFHIPIIYQNLSAVIARLKEKGTAVVAAALADAVMMQEVKPLKKMAFIIGNEGKGVRRENIAQSDTVMKIEMEGFESLNAAVAAGIIMYTFRK